MSERYSDEVMGIIAFLEQENRFMRARNERLQQELENLRREYDASKRIWQGVRDTGDND